MALCKPGCGATVPYYSSGCDLRTLTGGANRLIFKSCDFSIKAADGFDIYSEADWRAAAEACKLRITPEVLASKSRGSFTKARVSSCKPERTIYSSKTLNFSAKDYPTDFSNFTFWNAVDQFQNRFEIGWLMCTGELYGFYDFGLEIDEEFGDNLTTERMINGVVTIESRYLLKPAQIAENLPFDLVELLLEYQSWDCDTLSYASTGAYQIIGEEDFTD